MKNKLPDKSQQLAATAPFSPEAFQQCAGTLNKMELKIQNYADLIFIKEYYHGPDRRRLDLLVIIKIADCELLKDQTFT